MTITLFHVTDRKCLEAIRLEGMRSWSYWTSSERVAEYYAETVRDEDGDPVVISVELETLNETFVAPDYPSVEEPITSAIDMSEPAVHAAWRASPKTWRDSLRIVGSIRYEAPLPASAMTFPEESPGAKL